MQTLVWGKFLFVQFRHAARNFLWCRPLYYRMMVGDYNWRLLSVFSLSDVSYLKRWRLGG